MMIQQIRIKPIVAMLAAAGVLSACGGGGSSTPAADSTTSPVGGTPSASNPGGSPSTTTPSALPASVSAPMSMSCADGAGFQCSGGSIIRIENGIGLTSSGVQVYGRSTSDLASVIASKTSASGFELASGGVAEARIARDAAGNATIQALLLSNLGLSWDGRNERPQIVEAFQPTAGRTTLTSSGALNTSGALPASSDLAFYDYATRGTAGTQGNYANNRYFPRSGNPSRCAADQVPCPTTETSGVQSLPGDWRASGATPDWSYAVRLHEDGDVHAGDAQGGGILPDGDGIGVPFPGAKGYRGFGNWSFQYSNLGTWETQDTVLIEEWAALVNEHNKNRRGIVTYGAVSDNAAVPATGSATYSGIAYGWYASNSAQNPSVFRGTATATVDFATRQVTVTVRNAITYDSAGTPVPVNFSATAGMGAPGSNVANYLTGPVTAGSLSGGLSGRYFGPIVSTGSSGTGPAEIGGAFSLSSGSGGAAGIGGFIGRKQ